MNDEIQTGDPVATQKLGLACRNLQHLLKLKDEQTSLETIASSLEQSMIDAHANNPSDFEDILTQQVRILDAAFHYYLDESRTSKWGREGMMGTALKLQRLTQQSILAWHRLKHPKIKKFPKTN